MEPTAQKPELLVIVGPTASGKSDLALKVAQHFNGEIIAADSRTIYKGMDIGTAKPSKEDRQLVPHWGLNLVEPGHIFSAYQFKEYAEKKIKEIQSRGKLPILVGGTGLYIDSVLFDFDFVASADSEQRNYLESLSTKELQKIIQDADYPLPENFQNRRHLIRTIERKGKTGTKRSLKVNTIIIGLMPDSEELKKRIYQRAEGYFNRRLLEETQNLVREYGEEALQTSQAIAYSASLKVLKGQLFQEDAIQLIQKQEWQYARRQRTWFRRNKFINWFDSPRKAYKGISAISNN